MRQDRNLRFPRRDGTTTRWLTEPEVADEYRDRFRTASDQVGRVKQILDEGFGAMDLAEGAFVVGLAIVPTGLGSMTIDLAAVGTASGGPRTSARRISPHRASSKMEHHRRPVSVRTGSRSLRSSNASTARIGSTPSCSMTEPDSRVGASWIRGPGLRAIPAPRVWVSTNRSSGRSAGVSHIVGQHAAERCGAWGDALVEARLIGQRMQLSFLHRVGGFASPQADSRGPRT